jgi:hypothetical protein
VPDSCTGLYTVGSFSSRNATAFCVRRTRGRRPLAEEFIVRVHLSLLSCCHKPMGGDGLKSFAVGRYAPGVPPGHNSHRDALLSEGQPAEGSIAKDFSPSCSSQPISNEIWTGTIHSAGLTSGVLEGKPNDPATPTSARVDCCKNSREGSQGAGANDRPEY